MSAHARKDSKASGPVPDGSSWGDPPWRLAFECPPADPPARCEIAVVGGGLTGLAAALELARRAVRTVVFEAGSIGRGASLRSGGIVLEGTHIDPLEGADCCIDALAALVRREGIACDLWLGGCWELAHSKPAQQPELRELPWRDADRPVVVREEIAGGTLDPGALLAGLARRAVEAGAVICEDTPVTAISGSGTLELETPRGSLRAEGALLGLNAYTACLARGIALPRAGLTPVLLTEPLSEQAWTALALPERMPFYTVDLPYFWGRPFGERQLVFGAGLVALEPRPPAALGLPAEGRRRVLAAFRELEARLRALHPVLSEIGIERRWLGPIGFLPERPPLLGRHPSMSNLVVTGGYTGQGLALAVRAGQLAARALLDDAPLPAWGNPAPNESR